MSIDKVRTEDGITLYRTPATAVTRGQWYKPAGIVCAGKLVLVYIADKLPERHAGLIEQGYVYVNVASILSIDTSNSKLAKTARKFADVMSIIYYGAPSTVAGRGINTCSHASRACKFLCLNTAGNGNITAVQLARIARTRLSVWNPFLFWSMFRDELATFKRRAAKQGKRLACRGNGTTDERAPEYVETIRENPDIDFYDYSAVPSSLDVADSLPNYHVTFSRKETDGNLQHCREAYARGHNIAVVVAPEVKTLALRLMPGVFVDFDAHDLRLPEVDGVGKIGLLTPKGKMRQELKSTSARTMTVRSFMRLLDAFELEGTKLAMRPHQICLPRNLMLI